MSNNESPKETAAKIAIGITDGEYKKIVEKAKMKADSDVRTFKNEPETIERAKLLRGRLATAIDRWKKTPEGYNYSRPTRLDGAKMLGGIALRLNALFQSVMAIGVGARETGQAWGVVPESSPVDWINSLLQLPEKIAGGEIQLIHKFIDLLANPWPADALIEIQNITHEISQAALSGENPEITIIVLALVAGITGITGGIITKNQIAKMEYSDATAEKIEKEMSALKASMRSISSEVDQIRDVGQWKINALNSAKDRLQKLWGANKALLELALTYDSKERTDAFGLFSHITQKIDLLIDETAKTHSNRASINNW